MGNQSKQLSALDGLRVLATLAIFFFHAGILIRGAFPVVWFFMLSGFMMYYTKHTLTGYPNFKSWLGYVKKEKALKAFAWGPRGQFFWDGNKRTSMTLANRILLSAGAGILRITDKHMMQFNERLLNYYNSGDSEDMKVFLYENAIQGITL